MTDADAAGRVNVDLLPSSRERAALGQLVRLLETSGDPRCEVVVQESVRDAVWRAVRGETDALVVDPERADELMSAAGGRWEEGGVAESRLLRLFHLSPLPTVMTTLDGRILDVNQPAATLYGWDPSRASRSIGELEIWVEPERKLFEDADRERGRAVAFEARHRRSDGRVFDALLWSEPFELDGRTCLVTIIQDISDRRELERDLRRRAFHDSLTGLPNRDLLRDRLDHAFELARRHDRGLALLFLDLDGFKAVNDRYGHAAGDALLREVGRRLTGCLRDHDTVARWGGDEFVVLVEEVRSEGGVAEVADRIVVEVAGPAEIEGRILEVGVSVGVAIGPVEGEGPEELLGRADAGMYEAKRDPERAIHFAVEDT